MCALRVFVVVQLKEHFNCQNWPNAGAELEDFGGSGTAGSHWEKRVFFNEYMTGTSDPNSVYSELTLGQYGRRSHRVPCLPVPPDLVATGLCAALFEDSGWYQANYTRAQRLPWGYKTGCAFAQERCSLATWVSTLARSCDGGCMHRVPLHARRGHAWRLSVPRMLMLSLWHSPSVQHSALATLRPLAHSRRRR
jgi:hypothetical protein